MANRKTTNESKAKRETKIEIIQPKMPEKRGKAEAGAKKRGAVSGKDSKVENLYQAYAEVERTIQSLSRDYVEADESGHMNVGGTMKPTDKQLLIREQLAMAKERADMFLKMIERELNK